MIAAQPGRDPSVSKISAQPKGGPTVSRMLLGAQLRRLREAKGITREAAGYAIRGSGAKISRLERGRVGSKERDVADLLTLYGVVDQQDREALLALAQQGNEPGWWHRYGDILPSWFELYLGLEQAASVIRSYEVEIVPSLLQTEDYARTVAMLSCPGESSAEVDRRVSLRMARQDLLTQSHAPHMWAVVSEAALRKPLGGPRVMHAQLKHLIEITELPNITLQIAPLGSGSHIAAGGSFTVLRFSEPDLPDVVYLEQLTSALYLDKREDIDHYLVAMERLCIEAESSAETNRSLHRIIKIT